MKKEKTITDELFELAENNLPERLKKYSDSVKESLCLNELNLLDKAFIAPSIHHGFINCLFSEERTLKSLNELLENKSKEIESRYGKENMPRYKTLQYVEQNENIVKIKNAIEDQKTIISYIKSVLGVLSKFGFDVKNVVELRKIM